MDVEKIAELAKIVAENGLSRLETREGGVSLILESRREPAPREAAPAAAVAAAVAAAPAAAPVNAKAFVQTCPTVGAVYLSPAQGGKPFVAVGDRVKKGQTLCIIEAMKLFSELGSEADGVISAILVENGQVVGVGDRLFEITRE